MTNKKSTKKALFMSAMSLLLCFSMLVGTTFAWFTDSVGTANNIITAGNLDVNLQWKTSPNADWADVTSSTNIFKDSLWEPGHTEVVYLKVSNEGTLALKYNLGINIDSETASVNVNGDPFKLSDYILYNTYDGVETYKDSADARGDETGTKLNTPYNNYDSLEAGETVELTLVVFMPTTVGNEANYDKNFATPVINMGINLFATQYTHEEDTYGPDYDEYAKPVIVRTAEELAAALLSDEENISVLLANDIDVPMRSLGSQTGGSGEYKLGGENTKTILIDLGGNKLNISTTYMSAIGAKNADATITIKNGTMNSTGNKSTTWNINDLIFANCNYVFSDVTFDKEVALTNTGKSVSMKNVAINGTGNYYALWISARGQNVEIDGLMINTPGRGIKIDDQYAKELVAKVTLKVSNATINTNEKAAIMVKTTEGADITLDKVNVANTVDPINEVWVDEDATAYYDLVTVTGGDKAYEGDMITSAAKLQAALDAATDGTVIYLSSNITGNVTLTQDPNINITINGNGNVFDGTITIKAKSTITATGSITFENIKFKTAAQELNFIYSVETNHYPLNVTVSKCSFEGSGADSNVIGIKIKGAKNLTIKDCTATKLHSILNNTAGWDLTIDNVTVTECGRGMALGTVKNVTLTKVTVEAAKYGVRLDAGYDNNAVFTDCNIKAFIPVVVRSVTVDSKMAFNGTNTMTETNTDGLWLAIGTSEYEANGVLPTAAAKTVTVSGTDTALLANGIYNNSGK